MLAVHDCGCVQGSGVAEDEKGLGLCWHIWRCGVRLRKPVRSKGEHVELLGCLLTLTSVQGRGKTSTC